MKTALEWYAEQMQLKEKFTQEEFDNITNQAKEMEKQQQGYSEEDMTEYAMFVLLNKLITPKEWFEKIKNK